MNTDGEYMGSTWVPEITHPRNPFVLQLVKLVSYAESS